MRQNWSPKNKNNQENQQMCGKINSAWADLRRVLFFQWTRCTYRKKWKIAILTSLLSSITDNDTPASSPLSWGHQTRRAEKTRWHNTNCAFHRTSLTWTQHAGCGNQKLPVWWKKPRDVRVPRKRGFSGKSGGREASFHCFEGFV